MILSLYKEENGLKLIKVNDGFEVHKRLRTWKNGRVDWKVIFATPNLNLSGVTKIEEKDDSKLIYEKFQEDSLEVDIDGHSALTAYTLGYKQAQQNLFTEADLSEYLSFIENNYHYHSSMWHDADTDEPVKRTEMLSQYINSIKQPKVEIIFENNEAIKCIML